MKSHKDDIDIEKAFIEDVNKKLKIYKFLKRLFWIEILIFCFLVFTNIVSAFIYLVLFAIIDFTIYLYIGKDSLFKNIISTTILILIISAPVTYAISYYIKTFVVPKYPDIVLIGDESAWIGFAGSIVGGILTMLAVYFTIQNENNLRRDERKQREYELSMQSIPLLKLEPSSHITDWKMHLVTSTEYEKRLLESHEFQLPITINNTSNYIARNIKFSEANLYKGTGYISDFYRDDVEYIGDVTQAMNKIIDTRKTIPGNFSISGFVKIEGDFQNGEYAIIRSKIEYYDYSMKLKHLVEAEVAYCFSRVRSIKKSKVDIEWGLLSSSESNNFIE